MSTPTIGSATRIEAPDKVTGTAKYAAEHHFNGLTHAWVVGSAIAAGTVLDVDVEAAEAEPGVLRVIWAGNAPNLTLPPDPMLKVLQSEAISYRGQPVALVIAESPEIARECAATLDVRYFEDDFDAILHRDDPRATVPKKANGGEAGESLIGDPEKAIAESTVSVDHWYSTPAEHNNPMEPHATIARWSDGRLTVYDSNQGGTAVQGMLAATFGMRPSRVRVLNHHVGGGFGSKGTPRPNVVLAAMAAREVNRPVSLVLTRQQLFDLVGYRTPTMQRIRLGCDADGRLTAVVHDALSQTSTLKSFVEQSAACTRVMYAAPHRHTVHRVVALDVPIPSWMRAPGEAPGMFALESAMDELSVATGIDPIDLRLRNDTDTHPENGKPFSSRGLAECLRMGAERFGWTGRSTEPGGRREGDWLVGSGVAASTYPVLVMPSAARLRVDRSGLFVLSINATDIGTGARTALQLVAADELKVARDRVVVRIGDSKLPAATIAGGSMGAASWGWAVLKVCQKMNKRLARGAVPEKGISVKANTMLQAPKLPKQERHSFGAQFVEVRVNAITGEVRVPRMVGVFATGRILNAVTARSQFLGGMTMGLSMAVHEHGEMDAEFGDYGNRDLASYHVASNADVGDIDVSWIDEHDTEVNPLGVKGIGEIGIVGTAAAIANAVYDATGTRVRDLPITMERLLPGLPAVG